MSLRPEEVNPYAPPEVDLDEGRPADDPFDGFLGYAGFWRRFFAFVVDYFTIVLLMGLYAGVVQIALSPFRFVEAPGEVRALVTLLVFFGFTVGLPILYFSCFESSRHQATPGKIAFGIKVTTAEGRPVSFWRALGRLVGKFLSAVILYVGFLMIAFTRQKQGLHDIMARTLVVKAR